MKPSLVFKNATLLEGTALKVREDAYLVVEDDRIAAIGSGRIPEGLDLGGALVFPAFVNAHTHISDSIAKEAGVGLPTERAVSPPDGLKYRYLKQLSARELRQSLADSMREMWANGITAFGDFREGGWEGLAALKEVLEGKPIKAVIFAEPGSAASFIALNINSANLRNCRDPYSAVVHRAGPADIKLVVSWGKEVYRETL
ncbi:MAG: amidohydrolase family protein [Spirochaetota bacterium]